MKKLVIAMVLMMVATLATAQGGGGQHRGPGDGGGPAGFAGHTLVGADGTLYLVRDSATADSIEIVAVRTTGAIAWTATVPEGRGRIVLSGSNLIVADETTSDAGAVSTTLTGISTASGQTAWTRTLTGRVTMIEPFSGGTYVGLVVPAATSDGTATRSLVGIGNDGSVLWTLALT